MPGSLPAIPGANVVRALERASFTVVRSALVQGSCAVFIGVRNRKISDGMLATLAGRAFLVAASIFAWL